MCALNFMVMNELHGAYGSIVIGTAFFWNGGMFRGCTYYLLLLNSQAIDFSTTYSAVCTFHQAGITACVHNLRVIGDLLLLLLCFFCPHALVKKHLLIILYLPSFVDIVLLLPRFYLSHNLLKIWEHPEMKKEISAVRMTMQCECDPYAWF